MPWEFEFHDDFIEEYRELPQEVQDELLALIQVLEILGPQMKRPRVDTLNGSRHKNMKELRFDAGGGVWRFAFAFDLNRQAIILCGGDKSGGSENRFYKQMIAKADARFAVHCKAIKKEKKKS
jgi:hypothetical protein